MYAGGVYVYGGGAYTSGGGVPPMWIVSSPEPPFTVTVRSGSVLIT